MESFFSPNLSATHGGIQSWRPSTLSNLSVSVVTQPSGFRPRAPSHPVWIFSILCGSNRPLLWHFCLLALAIWIRVIGMLWWLRPRRGRLKASVWPMSVLWQIKVMVPLGVIADWPNFGFMHLMVAPIAIDCVNSICFEILFEFQVWDPGGKLGVVAWFFAFRRYLWVARLLIKETQLVWRPNALWFGAKDRFGILLEFLFSSIPYKLVEIFLYCFNKFQLDYCTVSTTIECIGEQHCRFFWDEDSLHQHVVVLFFYFQEVREHYVIDQPVRQLMVDVALDSPINLVWLIIAPAIVQDAPQNDCNRGYI